MGAAPGVDSIDPTEGASEVPWAFWKGEDTTLGEGSLGTMPGTDAGAMEPTSYA